MRIALLTTDNETRGFGIRSLSAVLRRAGHFPRLVFLPSEARGYCRCGVCAPAPAACDGG
ncbi:MAG: hypothetical protein HY822_05620 [Acidobacteria bacterium]|nr:hypothetical protein [Acidobacteriota bacterium]